MNYKLLLKRIFMCSFYGLSIQMILCASLLASGITMGQKVQSVKEIKVSIDFEDKNIISAFNKIEEETGFTFVYLKNEIDKKLKLNGHYQSISLYDLLSSLSRETGLRFHRVNSNINVKRITNARQSIIIEEKTITGKVTDENGNAVPGVNVLVKDTNIGTVTDVNGNFSLNVPDDAAVLVFSYVGYLKDEIEIGDKTIIDVSLSPDISTLSEIVVVGYGVQNKATLAGSVATVDASTFESRPVTNAVSALQGTVPGLIVTQTSSQPGNEGLGLQLRGLSSINGGNSPLILIDGIQSSFATLNPDDIESISVVKDGAAAIYGNQAANGVVLITTKKGDKNTGPVVNYNFTYGRNTPSYTAEKFTTREYMEVVNQGFVNDGAAPLYGDIFFDAIGTDQALNFNQTRLGGAEREDSWLVFNQSHNQLVDEIFETGIRQNHNLSISGGGQNSTYRLSLGYLNEDGVINTAFDGFERYNVRLNNTFDLTDKLTLTTQNVLEIGDRSTSTELFTALGRIPLNWTLAPVRRTDGEFYTFRGFVNSLDLLAQGGEAKRNTTRLISNAKLEYNIIDDLTATANIGVNRNTIRGRNEVPTIRLINEWTIDDTPGTRTQGNTNPNRLIETDETETYANFSGYLTYNKTIADVHNLALTGGFSHEQRRDNFISAEARNFPTNDLFSLAIGDVDEERVAASGFAWTLRSLFGRVNYSFNDKYIAEANIRYDGSSRFTPDKRWGLFTGYLVAWRASEESFIRDLNIFNNLKLRASYGETGNQEGIGFYDYLSLVNSGGGIIFGSPSGGTFGIQTENQTYSEAGAVSLERTWETVATTNFGIDIGVFDTKLNLSIDYFIKRNKDLLVGVDVPTVLGIGAPALNKGEMETKGWEILVNWQDNIGDFNYHITGTLFNDKNKLISLEGSEGVKGQGVNNRLIGYSVGTYFGWQFDGIIQNQDELDAYTSAISAGLPGAIGIGDVRYKDVDGNGELSALGNPANGDTGDLVELGNIRPQYSFSLDLGGDYKGFDFRILFQGVGKRTLFRGGQFSAPILGGQWFFQGARFFYGKTWTPENTGAKFPELSVNAGVNNYNYRPSINNKVNAAYARLKNFQIGYTLPSELMSRIHISKMRVFLSGENLFEIQSKLSRDLNFDPEAGTGSIAYPFVRTYSIGAQVTF
ncbi:TonB-dependent receptor [Fulvivirgaceae bacterium BMA10]|uniref:TonB-dependent receptor n=1 Tax=Splendidivirga corallicola TaxID=3051826 RepID=A0ABT8KW06_9BACT|nr:TonB-dependent receptor [Fulvivirgaceae bacterium BMA10]